MVFSNLWVVLKLAVRSSMQRFFVIDEMTLELRQAIFCLKIATAWKAEGRQNHRATPSSSGVYGHKSEAWSVFLYARKRKVDALLFLLQ